MLKKEQRISRTKEYNNIYKNGIKLHSRFLLVFCLPGREDHNRYGIVASKKVGNAVERNRARRQIRALVARYNDAMKKKSVDFVIIARPSIKTSSSEMLEKDFLIVMRKFINAEKCFNKGNKAIPEDQRF